MTAAWVSLSCEVSALLIASKWVCLKTGPPRRPTKRQWLGSLEKRTQKRRHAVLSPKGGDLRAWPIRRSGTAGLGPSPLPPPRPTLPASPVEHPVPNPGQFKGSPDRTMTSPFGRRAVAKEEEEVRIQVWYSVMFALGCLDQPL